VLVCARTVSEMRILVLSPKDALHGCLRASVDRRSRVSPGIRFSERIPPHIRADRVGTKGHTMSNFSYDERVKPFASPSPHTPFCANLRLLSYPQGMAFITSEIAKGQQSNLAPWALHIPLVIRTTEGQGVPQSSATTS
jgi:hypothetical protein